MTVPYDQDESPERMSPGDRVEAAGQALDNAGYAADAVSRCDGCDGCDALGACNLLRVSFLLLLVARLVPDTGSTGCLVALLHGYRRWLTRFTPRCPSTPSCSAYALTAVVSLGPRRGLAAAARRVRNCRVVPGPVSPPSPGRA